MELVKPTDKQVISVISQCFGVDPNAIKELGRKTYGHIPLLSQQFRAMHGAAQYIHIGSERKTFIKRIPSELDINPTDATFVPQAVPATRSGHEVMEIPFDTIPAICFARDAYGPDPLPLGQHVVDLLQHLLHNNPNFEYSVYDVTIAGLLVVDYFGYSQQLGKLVYLG